jgi:hypothetical protein
MKIKFWGLKYNTINFYGPNGKKEENPGTEVIVLHIIAALYWRE